jgi:hypothetical protein
MSFGSAIGAIVSLKNNRRPRIDRTEKHLAGKESVSGIKSHRTPSAEELKAIRERLQAENRNRSIKLGIISGVFLLLILAFFAIYMF